MLTVVSTIPLNCSVMFAQTYKKMAGTSAVFLSADFDGASPVKRDGMMWSDGELYLDQFSIPGEQNSAMSNVLAVEGLEVYATTIW